MPSGKQVLLNLLQSYSQQAVNESDLDEASENLRVAFLLHGSTAGDMWFHVERIAWQSAYDESNKLLRQGLAIGEEPTFLSDALIRILDKAAEDPGYRKEFDELNDYEYATTLHLLKLLSTAVDFNASLNTVEIDSHSSEYQQSLEKSLTAYKTKLKNFRSNPKEFLDADEEWLEIYRRGL